MPKTSSLLVAILLTAYACSGGGEPTPPPAIRVTLTPNAASVHVNRSVQLTAAVHNSTNTGVMWSLSGTGCNGASCGMISGAGLYTAPVSVPSTATVTVKATSVADISKSASATITILAAVVVTISPSSPTIAIDSTQQFTATVENAIDSGVTWGVSGSECTGPECGTISTTGFYTAPSVVPAAPAISITVTSVEDTAIADSATAMIVDKDPTAYKYYALRLIEDGVLVHSINAGTGALTAPVGLLIAEGALASLAVLPSGKFAYVGNISTSRCVFACAIYAATGELTAVAGSPFAAGGAGNSIAVDPSDKFVYVAHGPALLSVFSIDATTGALTAVAGSPFETGGAAYFVAVHPSGKFVYVITNSSPGYVSAFAVNAATGALTPVAGSPFAAGEWPVGVAVDPSGQFAYVANQSSNNVSAYSINATTGALTEVAGSPFAAGEWPFLVAVHPSGKFVYVANRTGGSDLVSAYIVNAATGALTSVAGSPFAMDGVGITVDPSGRFAYVERPGVVSVYAIDAVTGALTAIPGAQFAVVDRAGEMAVIRIAQ